MSEVGKPKSAAEIKKKDWDSNPVEGHHPHHTAEDVGGLCRAPSSRSTPWPAVAPRCCGSSCTRWSFVNSLGALTGNMARAAGPRAGLKVIYLSGWQVAGDANLPPHPPGSNSTRPTWCRRSVRRINNALLRADEIAAIEG